MRRGALLLVFVTHLAYGQQAGEPLPFRRSPNAGLLLVEAEVNGKARTFILDTGSQVTVVDVSALPLAEQFKLNAVGPATGDVGMAGAGRGVRVNLKFAGRSFSERTVVALNLSDLSKRYGTRIDGLIGLDVLGEFEAVTIDFREKQLRVQEEHTCQPAN